MAQKKKVPAKQAASKNKRPAPKTAAKKKDVKKTAKAARPVVKKAAMKSKTAAVVKPKAKVAVKSKTAAVVKPKAKAAVKPKTAAVVKAKVKSPVKPKTKPVSSSRAKAAVKPKTTANVVKKAKPALAVAKTNARTAVKSKPKNKPQVAVKSTPKSSAKSKPTAKAPSKSVAKNIPVKHAPKATTAVKPKPSPPAVSKPQGKPSTAAPAKVKQQVPVVKPEIKAAVKTQPVESVKAVARPPKTSSESQADLQASGARRQSGANLKFLVSVAQAIKDAVAPLAKAVKGREVVDEAPSGDVTFLLDRVAEKALFAHLKAAALPIAYYSEHEGYSTFSSKAPKALLIVDPIDGTRAAKNGFEGCVVAVASTRVIERPTIADVECACVMELLGDRIFLAERGKGARIYVDGRLKRPKLSENADLESLCWSMTLPARPAELIFPTAARIIDLSSLKGGFFACNSTSFSLTRLVTNQLDACVDIANRYYRDIPDRVEDYFINAGRGKVIGVAPYDIAASLLIAEEAGCIVTDAYGKRFDNLLLLDSSTVNHQSIIAAANASLHEKLLSFFDTRIKQYELLLTRHAGKD